MKQIVKWIATRLLKRLVSNRELLMGLQRINTAVRDAEDRLVAKIDEAAAAVQQRVVELEAEVASVKAQNVEVIGTLGELKELVSNPPDTSNAEAVLAAVAERLGVQVGELAQSRSEVDAAEEAADPTSDEPPVEQ